MKLSLLLFLIATHTLFAKSPSNRVDYQIDVVLNPDTKQLKATQTIKYTNNTSFQTNKLVFHLYLNAFKDANSTFMKESINTSGMSNSDIPKKKERGYILIKSMKSLKEGDLLKNAKYIQLDDGNIKDQTVLETYLRNPLQPNQSILIELNFEAQLPKIVARTGWAEKDYFFIGQWFPKLGVLENKPNQWNCHQFHKNSEFFSDFGDYTINITVPTKFKIGATGVQISELKQKNKQKTVLFKATDVHDFAWSASPHFEIFNEKYGNITLKTYMQPEHKQQVNRYLFAVKKSIDFLEKHVGTYPHKTLTIIDPPLDGAGSGGMEYPTLITCGSYYGVGKWLKMAEIVTIHEFTHQYFQGILASNEFEESWLDEGFTQYIEGRIMDDIYVDGSQVNIFGFKINDLASSRQGYVSMDNPAISESYRYAWQYPKGTYGVLSYQKTATWLKTLEGLLGQNNLDEVLKTYFSRWKFKHPKAEDFIAVVNEIAAKKTKFKSMNWFFNQVLYTAPVCDYAVDTIYNNKNTGYFTVVNKGKMYIPVQIKVIFDNDESKIISWEGKEEKKTFRFNNTIKSIIIDPQTINWLDLNMINNSKSISKKPHLIAHSYGSKILFWLQQAMLFFA